MSEFTYMGNSYQLDAQGCLLDPEAWDENFAEGMARECEVPVLSSEHWDVIRFIRNVYVKTHVCPTVFATCKAVGLLLQDGKRLFPTGYHGGACRISGVHYRVSQMPYGAHIKQSVADMRALSADKVYSTDARGFLVNPDNWDENFAAHRALEMKIPLGKLTDEHWRIIYYLRDVYQVEHRIPNIYETCENCNLDLDSFEALFPDGYHRGALKIAGLRFLK